MASLYISEFASVATDAKGRGVSPVPQQPAAVTQKVAISGSSGQSSAFATTTRFVQIHTDAICSVVFGTDPTATSSEMRMAAGETRLYGVEPGQKVAVITNS